jgi:hypothetical protein
LGFNIHVTHRRATEHYLTNAAIKRAKGPSFRALAPYEDFETVNPRWGKGENWRIAQRMVKADLDATDIGPWLSSLKTETDRRYNVEPAG